MEDSALLQELGDFLASVKGTLETFIFGQGTRRGLESGWPLVHPVRTMDRRYGQYIFPKIVQGSWPCLKRMEITDVRSSADYNDPLPVLLVGEQYGGVPFAASIEDQIRAVVGQDVVLVVDEECRTFDDLEMHA